MTKSMVLGCGYSMGANKFVMAAPALTQGKYLPTMAEAEKIVTSFKRNNPKIVALWRRLDREFKAAHSKKENYTIVLPSGRELTYREISSIGGWSCKKTAAAHRTKMWYGILVENLTQATARDVLTFAWKNVVDAGFNVLFTVHDEIVVEVDEAHAEEALKQISQIMRQEPSWMPGLPLEIEAEITKFYKK